MRNTTTLPRGSGSTAYSPRYHHSPWWATTRALRSTSTEIRLPSCSTTKSSPVSVSSTVPRTAIGERPPGRTSSSRSATTSGDASTTARNTSNWVMRSFVPRLGSEPMADALLGPAEIRELAARLGVAPTKKLGQNFLHDPNTIRRIVNAAGLTSDDVALEVGPGLGSLTLGLVGAVRHVHAVEIDARLAAALPETVTAAHLTVHPADALRVTGDRFDPPPTMLVANLPYNVAVPVVLHLLAELP